MKNSMKIPQKIKNRELPYDPSKALKPKKQNVRLSEPVRNGLCHLCPSFPSLIPPGHTQHSGSECVLYPYNAQFSLCLPGPPVP